MNPRPWIRNIESSIFLDPGGGDAPLDKEDGSSTTGNDNHVVPNELHGEGPRNILSARKLYSMTGNNGRS